MVILTGAALLTSVAVLITNEYISKLKIRSNKLRDWINVITLLYENFLKNFIVAKKFDQKEAEDIKKTYNHYLDKRKDIMSNTQFKVEDILADVISKGSISQERITKLNNFSAEIM